MVKEKDFLEMLENKNIINFLQENKVYLDEASFIKELTKQKNPTANVVNYHQLSLDYRWSVVAKMAELVKLKNTYSTAPVIVWSDIDRADRGGDKNKTIINVSWPLFYKKEGISLVPDRMRISEIRFTNILKENFDKFINAIKTSFPASESLEKKLASITKMYEEAQEKLGTFNYLLSQKIIYHYFHTEMLYARAHEIFAKKHHLVKIITKNYLTYNNIFNQQTDLLNQLIPSFRMPKKEENELPFYITCHADLYRNRMYVKKFNEKPYGFAICHQCSKELTFDLENFSLEELEYISPDLSLPIYLADEYDGFIGGISSSLYIVIFNKIITELLGLPAKPTLIPSHLLNKPAEFEACDSLFYYFLTK